MKTCPYCNAENQDEAAVCHFCGNHLDTWRAVPGSSAAGNRAEPTQPVRPRGPRQPVRTPGPGVTQPMPSGTPSSTTPSGAPFSTQPMPVNPSPPLYPRSTSAYRPAYPQTPVYVPPPPPLPPQPVSNPPSRHILPILVIGLAAVLVFACGFAVWTLTSATSSAAQRLRSDLATQAAGIIPPAATPRPAGPDQPVEPTPWPTFTPQPQAATPSGASDPTLDATQSAITDLLLSEGCSTALDNLGRLSDQITNQPTIAFDATWRESLNQAVADMKTNCGTLDAASPVPGQIGQAHQNLAQAQSEFDLAGKLFDEGVRDLAPSKLLEAGQHVAQAVKYLNQAITELRKIGR